MENTLFHKAVKASSESLDLEHGELWVRMQRFEATTRVVDLVLSRVRSFWVTVLTVNPGLTRGVSGCCYCISFFGEELVEFGWLIVVSQL